MVADLILGMFVWAAATGTALRALKFFRMEFGSAGERLVFSSALGLGLFAYLIFLLGLFKALYATPVLVSVVLLFMFFIRGLAKEVYSSFSGLHPGQLKFFPDTLYILAAAVVLIFSLAGALAPPVGQDELCYHLMQPKNYVNAHAVYEVPYSTSALWPYLMEMLFTLGVLLRGPELAKFFHFTMFLNAVGAIYCFGRRFGAGRAGFFAALVFLLTPAVFIQASFAYVDNALACYAFLTAYALFVYFQNGKLSWAILAGAMTGLTISVKLIGLFVVPLAVLSFFWFILRGFLPRKKLFAHLVFFLAAAAVFGGAWYLRSWSLRGNPFFPFYSRWFGGHGWQIATYIDSHGRGQDLFSFFLLPWDTALHPGWFGGEHIGPMYLALLPLVFFVRPVPSVVKFTLAFGTGFTALWFMVDPNIRFFLPALAIFSIGAGSVMAHLTEGKTGWFKKGIEALFILMFATQASFAVYHFKDAAGLWFGGDPQRYVSTHDRSFRAAKMLNPEFGPKDRIISIGEVRGYYFNAPFTIEGEVNRFTDYGARLNSVDEVAAFLKKEGFTHALYFYGIPFPEDKNRRNLRLPFLLKRGQEWREHFKEVSVARLGDARYILYKIL